MSDTEETYCRLCAEVTPEPQLISTDDDVGLNSKIAMKMSWINIEISNTNKLPNTICFACFDQLERTWSFLHNVRSAQLKLNEILLKKDDDTRDSAAEKVSDIGKPIDEDWEEFQKTKTEVKREESANMSDIILETNHLTDIGMPCVKIERVSDNEVHDENIEVFSSSDSDMPLRRVIKKKKIKKKKKCKSVDELEDSNLPSLTWEDQVCRCAKCDAQCKNVATLRLHSLQIHSCCCTFKCCDCGKVTANYKSFVNHVRLHKSVLRHCCEFCNKYFRITSLVKKHRKLEHHNVYLTTCQHCGSNFESEELLQDHLLIYRKTDKKLVKQENPEFELKCEHCSKEFKSRSNLQQHKLVHTERRRDFSCHVCGKMFFTKGTLSSHMLVHEDTKPFKCEYCPMAFKARGNLHAHKSLHSGVKPFVCEQCGKSFRVKRHLKSHSIVHTDLMPYICEYCNKPFRFKTRLNLHLRQHTGAKPYRCICCERDFTNGSNYKKHMKRRHNIDITRRRYNNIVNMDIQQTGDETTVSHK